MIRIVLFNGFLRGKFLDIKGKTKGTALGTWKVILVIFVKIVKLVENQ